MTRLLPVVLIATVFSAAQGAAQNAPDALILRIPRAAPVKPSPRVSTPKPHASAPSPRVIAAPPPPSVAAASPSVIVIQLPPVAAPSAPVAAAPPAASTSPPTAAKSSPPAAQTSPLAAAQPLPPLAAPSSPPVVAQPPSVSAPPPPAVAAPVSPPIAAPTSPPARELRGSRFSFQRVKDTWVRFDGRTGQVSVCSHGAGGWSCQAAPDDRAALETEIGRLTGENAILKKQLAAHAPLPPSAPPAPAGGPPAPAAGPPTMAPEKAPDKPADVSPQARMPSDAELESGLNFLTKAWRRMVEMVAELQRDIRRRD